MCLRKRCCLACPRGLKAHGAGAAGSGWGAGNGLFAEAGEHPGPSLQPSVGPGAGCEVLAGAGCAPRPGCGWGRRGGWETHVLRDLCLSPRRPFSAHRAGGGPGSSRPMRKGSQWINTGPWFWGDRAGASSTQALPQARPPLPVPSRLPGITQGWHGRPRTKKRGALHPHPTFSMQWPPVGTSHQWGEWP